jgi:GntR family transcriptional regulator
LSAKLDESKPIFVQIAEELESGILDDTFPEGSRVPSTNEFAAYYQINPATAAKGINRLVDEGILF